MKKNKIYVFLGLALLLCLSVQAQESIQNLNQILGQERNVARQVTTQSSAVSVDQLKHDFFEARGIISVVNANEAVKWERADKPVEVFQITSVAEIDILRNAYPALFSEIQTIMLKLGNTELSDSYDAVARLAREMPQLRNILISSYALMPSSIDQELSRFVDELSASQINTVSVYYYQTPQPK